MPYIENVSYSDIQQGKHFNKGKDSVLIQIINPGHYNGYPKPKDKFIEVHQFEILDAGDYDGFQEDALFTQEQAEEIMSILVKALDSGKNVLVHCHMGVSRSGAVALVGSFIGFQLRHKGQVPNRRMLKLLEREIYNNYQDYI